MIETTDPIAVAYPICGVGQIPAELKHAAALYKKRKPSRVLEIGTWYGGTLREWLTGGKPKTVVSVDTAHLNTGQYEEWRHKDTNLVVISGRSQDPNVRAEIAGHGPFDWIFIDGDHGEAAVSEDVNFSLDVVSPGGVILMHDIAAEGGTTGPRRVFDILHSEGYRTEEIIATAEGTGYPDDSAHGIGVIYP